MRSIREVCSRDYTAAQIAAWGNRPFLPGFWEATMVRDEVWVVERQASVLGFVHLTALDSARAEVATLFLVPEALGQGLGRKLLAQALERARERGFTLVILHATKTALGFYLAHGFRRVPGCEYREIAGERIDCFPMERGLP